MLPELQIINKFGFNLSEKELSLFEIYLKILQEWNKKINITSLKNTEDIIIKHFIDSLSVVRLVNISGSLVDIGSGGGFPGIPIKIVVPYLELTLIEANRKKSNFLRTIIRRLNLDKVEIYNCRVESFEKEGCFDVAISRAFAKVSDFCREAYRLIKPNGSIISMSGKEQAIDEGELRSLNLSVKESYCFNLPLHKGFRTITVFRKCFT